MKRRLFTEVQGRVSAFFFFFFFFFLRGVGVRVWVEVVTASVVGSFRPNFNMVGIYMRLQGRQKDRRTDDAKIDR